MWKHLRHQNIVPFIGVTQDPLQFVSEWMPNGTLTQYLGKNSGVNRIGLVSPSRSSNASLVSFFFELLDVAEGLAYLHAKHATHGDLKGVSAPPRDAFIKIDDLPLAQHSRRPQWSCPFDRLRLYLDRSWVEFDPCNKSTGIYSKVGRTGGHRERRQKHTGGRCLCFWHGCDRGRFSDRLVLAVERPTVGLTFISCQVFTGKCPFSELTDPVAVSKIMACERPDRPREQDLTDPVWDMTVQCWQQDPSRRHNMNKVVTTLREW